MIALEQVSARSSASWGKGRTSITDVSLTWEHGVLAVLGSTADGTAILLETIAGIMKVRSGRAIVDGRDARGARGRIAHVPRVARLPDSLRVDECCTLAAELRGETVLSSSVRLGVLGLESLAPRRVRSLTAGEARAVSLALALTSNAPVVLVDEPLAGLDAAAPARVVAALRARAQAGAAVVITTSSVRDATRLGDQLGVLTKGIFTHLPASLAHVGPGGARLRVVIAAESTPEVAPFVAALSEEAAVGSVETAAFVGSRVLHAAVGVMVSGKELLGLARAVSAAASRVGARVLAIESAVMPLDAIRAALLRPPSGMLPKVDADAEVETNANATAREDSP